MVSWAEKGFYTLCLVSYSAQLRLFIINMQATGHKKRPSMASPVQTWCEELGGLLGRDYWRSLVVQSPAKTIGSQPSVQGCSFTSEVILRKKQVLVQPPLIRASSPNAKILQEEFLAGGTPLASPLSLKQPVTVWCGPQKELSSVCGHICQQKMTVFCHVSKPCCWSEDKQTYTWVKAKNWSKCPEMTNILIWERKGVIRKSMSTEDWNEKVVVLCTPTCLEVHLPAPATDRSIFTLHPQPHKSIFCPDE